MPDGRRELRAKLTKARRELRDARRVLDQADHWTPDEDVLDLLREIRGLTVLAEECVRSGRALDEAARELWLYEHGYKR